MKAKRYGDAKTHLTLSAKAEKVYSETDPISIWERYDDDTDDYIYDITEFDERYGLTETEVNEYLEDLYDEIYGQEDEETR